MERISSCSEVFDRRRALSKHNGEQVNAAALTRNKVFFQCRLTSVAQTQYCDVSSRSQARTASIYARNLHEELTHLNVD
jgi:hypothetical protein